MLSRLVRVLLALTAISPLSVSLAFQFARSRNYLWASAAVATCLALGFLAGGIIAASARRLETLRVTITKAKSADKEVIGFFIAYALPLIFKPQPSSPDLVAWLVAAAMLLFVLWGTQSAQVNPVLGLLGYHFYEVDTDGGVSYLMITRRRISNVLSVKKVVQISDFGILEAPDQK
ncbi:hypothetical protein [Caballeronia sp. GAFFF2]|uniref:hypothetical protein n=1 Tax=Caballeronia sp. GAFFF2 TaxID=2921741 RepID=UPI0020288B88|nr:hypothetical protein [Caballeronia sp. GAFFF2]